MLRALPAKHSTKPTYPRPGWFGRLDQPTPDTDQSPAARLPHGQAHDGGRQSRVRAAGLQAEQRGDVAEHLRHDAASGCTASESESVSFTLLYFVAAV